MIRGIRTWSSLLLVLGAALSASALDEVNVTSGGTVHGPGLAVHGYDVVAYFTEGKPRQGSATFSVAYEGGTYRFANQANLEAFQAEPGRYAPAYGGFCAYGVSVGKKFDGDPRFWKIEDGRLFLNLNGDIQKKWLEDVPGHVAEADQKWRRIAAQRVADL